MLNAPKKSDQPEGSRKSPLILRIAKFTFFALAVGLALYQLIDHWGAVTEFNWRLNPGWLSLSIVAHVFTLWLFSLVWCRLIQGFGHSVPAKYGFKIAYITTLSRYLPGRFWPVFGMAYFAKRLGIPEQESVTSWVVSLVFALASAFAASAAGLLLEPSLMQADIQRTIGSGVIIGGLVLIAASIALVVIPGPTLAVLNVLLKALRRKRLTFRLSYRVAAEVIIGYFLCWIAYGLSFWLFVKSVTGEGALPIIPLVTTFIIAYQLGYLALFSPGGVGVRELVLIGLLTPYLGPVVAGIAIAARLWNLIVEMIAFLIAWRIPLPDRSHESTPAAKLE